MNQFDILIARNVNSDFNDWHDAIRAYSDIDGARNALYEAARRSPWLHVSFAYGGLVLMLTKFYDWRQTQPEYNSSRGEEALAGYVFRTFRLLSAMNAAHSDLELTSTYPVRRDIVEFLDSFILSHS